MINFLNHLNNKESMAGYWWRDFSIPRSSPMVKFSKSVRDEDKILELSANEFTANMSNIETFINAVNELTALFQSDEFYKSHQNIWNYMQSAQKKTK